MQSDSAESLAVVVGAGGGIGSALVNTLRDSGAWGQVIGLGRNSDPPLDLTREKTVIAAARAIEADGRPLRLLINAAGLLAREGGVAEKNLQQIDVMAMQRVFAVNTLGPALLLKHFLPLFPAKGRSVFASLSARVGSIGDNRLGGWYSYRASKAALNQLIRTASIELRRSRPDAVCVAIHPGTVATALSAPFAKGGLETQPPEVAARRIVDVLGTLEGQHSGSFLDQHGLLVPW
jgi:NAD(P)-dependent dehydrogenase (short-subunit alcohol dehydrogenase family)